MAELISEEKLNEVRQAVDIVDLVGEYVQLTKQGRNYFGLCPFHGENTPSFSVSPEKQIYHCFGCQIGGNSFSFLMEMERMSFIEAVHVLAAKGNIDLPVEAGKFKKQNEMTDDMQQMVEAHELLQKLYHHILMHTTEGEEALAYLKARGFDEQSLVKFQVGYALDSWDYTTKFLTSRGYPPDLVVKAGLIIARDNDGTHFDRFRHRIMFPIFDERGKTIAFSGRALGEEDEPKYLNSPETIIFNKSNVLYHFHLARQSIRKENETILFEGFADVIAADHAGVPNSVATMGTSLTDAQAATIRRNSKGVIICYDGDSAGIEASFRAGNLLADKGCDVRVAMLPDGTDPDDFIKEYGAETFRNEILSGSLTFVAFKLHYYRRGKNLQNEGDRLLYIEEVLKEISMIPNAVDREHYLKQISKEFSISLEALMNQQKQYYYAARKSNQHRQQAPRVDTSLLKEKKQLKPAYYTAERYLLAHMLRNADVAYKVERQLQGQSFNIDEHQAIYTYLLGFYEGGNEPSASALLTQIPDEKLRKTIVQLEMLEMNEELSEQELQDYLKQILNYEKLLQIKEKEIERKEAEFAEDFDKAAQIAMEIIKIRKTL